ncbi:trans-aconitate 2-methyltransferase [Paenarthrobacter aurescens]|uniref:Trans-aconitate 2-methyltransferase n=1 Tax=Paenarthrobacter aurescens TaxID=43663 RepID=A0A4Y3ND53_PAEAU|nr:trans-aconitate 2-methyltransferase [Paenarthrobacter aurescens]MDO6143520.1 trans-aconitate 2-methyltransferase [Paenarthrobacter aurescens]MDO6147368.1 trans-aconitate 2-methyltransferase [Paenarthrobacter aurescens]MDO6158612.1 trans-aconitate 2-methyltransferase [Paenarthrobacter aurescens]MDO6162595.1 trans-aconitate 2-methyltransferase [Paenarthrobacter aurescens]GEB19874.1 trans-aconitate 2-methyltransferase [Paenarthrobacter aurescens]
MEWDPSKYVEFGNHRDRPFHDLVARVRSTAPVKVVDLGCGPGNLTATLADRWPGAQVVGIDSSPEMLQRARSLWQHSTAQKPDDANPGAGKKTQLTFEPGDIAQWEPDADTDVVVTNAALQWVPGHEEMMASWLRDLKPGAWFAMQVPGNFTSPSHTLMRQLAESRTWSRRLGGVLRHDGAVGSPADYLGIMLDAGCAADAWETTYQQVLHGEDPVLEWVRGTGLRPVLAALSAEEAAEFEKEYSALLSEAYPSTPHGTIFPFRRIFAVAQKPA